MSSAFIAPFYTSRSGVFVVVVVVVVVVVISV